MKMRIALWMFLYSFVPLSALGQVLVAPVPANQVTITVDSTVSFDSNSNLYTYSYTINSALESLQEVTFFLIKLEDEAANIISPEDWSANFDADTMTIVWGAVGVDQNWVDDGGVPPSPSQIKPGESLAGFSFQSASPATSATFYAQGYVPTPIASSEDDFVAEGYELTTYLDDSVSGQTQGPMAPEYYSGNRRPAVDGFLGFINIGPGSVFTSPATIAIKFSLAGETVDRSSFNAVLNNVDVTSMFVSNDQLPGDLSATFTVEQSPLQSGKNVLITSVVGQVPGTTRAAADTDRITFKVQ